MQLQARVSVKRESSDGSFIYTEDLEELKKMNPILDKVEPWLIKVGTVLNIEDAECTVKGLMFEVYNDTENSKYGVRMNGVGESHPCNLKVVLVVI